MTRTPATLLARLFDLASADDPPRRFVVAYSGGRDSSVLLHALASGRGRQKIPVVAIHANHQLHADADDWQAHCRVQAESLGVSFIARTLTIGPDAPGGIEAAARSARYALFSDVMESGDWLLTAHHAGDQAETLLMNLMRGSGVSGLAGIGERQPFARGQLVRPLLGCLPHEIAGYAATYGLVWVEDPSNDTLMFDRNFLRRQVVPLLESRWPAAVLRMARSAALCGEAAELLEAQAAVDLAQAGTATRLSIRAMVRLAGPRQRTLLRYAVKSAGLPPVPARQLQQILAVLLPARPDAAPLVQWTGAAARRYRQHLYFLPQPQSAPSPPGSLLFPDRPLDLGVGYGQLSLSTGNGSGGIDRALAARGLAVRFRQGGETLQPYGHECTHTLKKLLQQKSIVPWMRPCIPLLYAADELVAVADLWISANRFDERGYCIHWHEPPTLY